jgi:predicted NBD/HSP70 family sugar kinase
MKTTGDLQLLKRINRSALLRLMLGNPGLSRARLAVHSGLTKSTVSGLVRELIDEQWLEEAGATVAAEGMGRPSTPLRINDTKRALIGVEIAVECIRVVCVSLTGAVLSESETPLKDMAPDKVAAQAARMVQKLWLALRPKHLILCGIGVSLLGAINDLTGIVRLAPNLGWRNVAFLDLISTAFTNSGLPSTVVHLQNDADAAALGEYEFGAGAGSGDNPLIFINCEVGVGAGIVLNDRLFTGSVGTAGEIGHTILQVDGPLCSCGRRGCAEAFIGARTLRKRSGMEHAGQYLGVLMQNLDVMFNPSVLVLGGRSCLDNPDLVTEAQHSLLSYVARSGMPAPEVRTARYGLQAAAVGAAALVLHRFLRPMNSSRALAVTDKSSAPGTGTKIRPRIEKRNHLREAGHVFGH